MIVISEKAIPVVIDGWSIVRGKKDKTSVYVARNETCAGWGLSSQEAITAAKRKGP